MEHDFWRKKWATKEIGFHLDKPNQLLMNNICHLGLRPGSRIFVPLCGKSLDIAWLVSQGYQVVGVELVESAVESLFEDASMRHKVVRHNDLKILEADKIKIFIGDLFNLTRDLIGEVDVIYDRAALVALPFDMRRAYAALIKNITRSAKQLLIAVEYDQTLISGPPFSVTEEEVASLYGEYYTINCLQRKNMEGGLKGKCAADEVVWLLSPQC